MSLESSDNDAENFNDDNSCSNWANPSKTRIFVSSIAFALVCLVSLAVLAAWSYTTSLTNETEKSQRTKAYVNKNGIRYFKDDMNDYISETKTSSPYYTNKDREMASGIPVNPFIATQQAIPNQIIENIAGKPYVVPAQPNDLNLDVVDESPRTGNADPIISDGKPIDARLSSSDVRTIRYNLLHNLGKPTKLKNRLSSPNYGVDKERIGQQSAGIINVQTESFPTVNANYKEGLSLIPTVEDSTNDDGIALDMNSMNPSILSTEPQMVKMLSKGMPHSPEVNAQPPMNLYRIHNAMKYGAVCLDGSVPAYYHRPGLGTSERLWIIHFNGGAWCFDAKACFERSHTSLGSTIKLPASPPIIQGINSPDPAINPDFHDWNLVWVVYCDGASFTGNQDRPLISENGDTLYMRGKRVLNAIINDLLYRQNLNDAEALILTGSSAGSMTAIFQADYIASKLPKTIPVRVFSDAGFFIDTSHIGGKNLQDVFKAIYFMQNSSSGLNQDCINDVGLENGWQCFFPAKAVQYVKTPIFVLNSLYDIWAIMYFIGINCKFPTIRQQERKKRSLYRNFLFDENLEDYIHSSHKRKQKQFEYIKEKRDISGFEIMPYFRTPLYSVDATLKGDIPKKKVDGPSFILANGSRYSKNNGSNDDALLRNSNVTRYSGGNTNNDDALFSGSNVSRDSEKNAGYEDALLSGSNVSSYPDKIAGNEDALLSGSNVSSYSEKIAGNEDTLLSGSNVSGYSEKNAGNEYDLLSGSNVSSYSVKIAGNEDALLSGSNVSSYSEKNASKEDALFSGSNFSRYPEKNKDNKDISFGIFNVSHYSEKNNGIKTRKERNTTLAVKLSPKQKIKVPSVSASKPALQRNGNNSQLSALLNKLKSFTSDKTLSYLSHDIMANSFRKNHLSVKQLREVSEIDSSNIINESSQNKDDPSADELYALSGILTGYKRDRVGINETNRSIVQHIRLKLLDFLIHHQSRNRSEDANNYMVGQSIDRLSTRNKTRRSTSIAKEYINILRSDPPECTEKEVLTAMLYRDEIIRATNNLRRNLNSGRFLISCINHSSSLFDETWTTLKVGGKTIQQAFGDWFFDRDGKGNYDLVDCPYPCNPTCP